MTTRSRLRPLLALLATAPLVAGCLGQSAPPQIRYYTVVLTPEGVRLPFGVRVSVFGAAPAYRTTRLAIRRSPYQMDYYDFSRWASNPQSLIAAALQRYFDRVGRPDDPHPVEVSGRIERLEAVAQGEEKLRASAVLSFDARARENRLLARTYEETMPVEGSGDPEDVVAALSRALDRILARFCTDLDEAVRAAPPPRAGAAAGRPIESAR